MTRDRIEHHILWHCSLLSSSEHALLAESEDGCRLQGVAVLPLGELPCHIDYAVAVDRWWRPSQARATITTPSGTREIVLRSHRGDGWEVDGELMSYLDGCPDVDFGWTPATNTVPIRRLGLDVGETASITAAWVRFPELDVVASEQRYRRLAIDRWQYTSGEYDYQLVIDPDTGLVLSYGDDLWRAAVTAFR
ncbi:MAG: putative glycolipid-binding domain-containing protein [Streptosporangiaceae bacterium]